MLYNPQIMANPENKPPTKTADVAIRYRMINHKSPGLQGLQKIVEHYFPLKNHKILTIIDGEEEALLDNELREVRERTRSFGVPDEVFARSIAADMLKAENIIIEEAFDVCLNN
jgi:hypothetical protein